MTDSELVPATHAVADPANDRQQQLNDLYTSNFGFIIDAASADTRLLTADAHHISEAVARHLGSYDGPIQDDAFQAWAADIINPAVERFGFFYDLMNQYEGSIFAGVWEVLGRARDLADADPVYVARTLAADTWAWVFEHVDDLMIPGTAKLATRLYARARITALAWRTDRLRHRERFADIDVFNVGKDEGGQMYFESRNGIEEAA
jgi:hypothetical protein